MNRSQTVAVADAATAIRPDWHQPGTIAAIRQAELTWQGTDADLAAHTLRVAANPEARTPAAITITPTPAQQRASQHRSHDGHTLREPACHACGRPRGMCLNVGEWELRHGVPDPHSFETLDDAVSREAHRQVASRPLPGAEYPSDATSATQSAKQRPTGTRAPSHAHNASETRTAPTTGR